MSEQVSKISIVQKLAQIVLIANVLIVISVLRVREYGSDSIDFQIILKLAVWAVCLGMALYFWRMWVKRFLQVDNALMIPMIAVMTYSTFYAPSLSYSIGALFSMIAVFLFMYSCSDFMSEKSMMFSIFLSISIVCLISIVMYFVNPEMSRMKEWVGTEQVLGTRMSGLTTTPNSMGLAAAFGLILLYYYYRFYGDNFLRPDLIIFGLLQLVALLMTNSRTSIIAVIATLVVVYFLKPRFDRLFILFIGVAAVVAFISLADLDAIFAMMSRSGDAEEITSGTGRTHIWETALHLIGERPFTGYGYASTTFILPNYAEEIGHVPSTTHNIFLQILFTMGYPALFVFILMFAVKFIYAFKYQDSLKLGLLVFILIAGLTEPSIFRGVAGMSALIFAMAMGMHYLPDQERDENRGKVDIDEQRA